MNDDIGKPPPNSQPYRNLGASPVVLRQVYLPPRDPHLGVIASRLNSNPWEASLTPRTRMWMDEFWDYIGEYGLHFVYPYYYEVGDGKGRMWRRTKGKVSQGKR